MSLDFASLPITELRTIASNISNLSAGDRAAFAAYIDSNPQVGRALGISGLAGDFHANQYAPGALTSYLPQGDGVLTSRMPPGGRQIAGMLFTGASAAVEAKWSAYVGELAQKGGPIDVNDLVQAVLREAYLANTEDLRFFAEKVKFFNELKKEIRNELTRARDAFAATAGEAETFELDPPFHPKEFEYSFMGHTDAEGWETRKWEGRSADAGFQARTDGTGWEQTAAVLWDPLAIDLDGDGKVSTIATPNGSFLVDSEIAERVRTGATANMNITTSNVTSSSAGILARVTEQQTFETRFTQWFAPTEGVVVMDRNGDGQIQSPDLFGDWTVTGRNVGSGYEDLALLDRNQDGKVDRNDQDFMRLRIWKDANSDGVAQAGELSSLYANNVISLSTQATGGAVVGENAAVIREGGSFTGVESLISVRSALDAYIKKMEEKLNSVGDDAQLANVDLQNMLQKQQQTLQMVSNISKMLHDTAMAVIRKIGG
jgi:hypothetical protein